MSIFETKTRTRIQPLRAGEDHFSFYDEVTDAANDLERGPAFDHLRRMINLWINELPTDIAPDFIHRMKTGEFDTALPELVTHAMFLRLGFKVKHHPEVPNTTKHPDFLVTDQEDAPLFYVEVTTINHSQERVAHDNRESAVISALNRATIPAGCRLWYNLIRAGSDNPKVSKIVSDVELWSTTVVQENPEPGTYTEEFRVGNWAFEIGLIVTSKELSAGRNIAGGMMTVQQLTPAEDLRTTLDTKSKRYGKELPIPYLIVVADATGQFSWGQKALRGALFETFLGDEVHRFVQLRDGSYQEREDRQSNGFWRHPQRIRNKQVSGVLLLPDAGLWRLREPKWQPILSLNPWATHALPEHALPLSRLAPRAGIWKFIEGKSFADLLEIPSPWPE